jgi:hypothetical protein
MTPHSCDQRHYSEIRNEARDRVALGEEMREETTISGEGVFSATSLAQDSEEVISHVPCADSQTDDGVYTILSTLSPKTLITEDGLARLLGKCCRESVKRAVERDELPRPVRLMGKNTWTVGAIVQHIETRLETEARRFARARS